MAFIGLAAAAYSPFSDTIMERIATFGSGADDFSAQERVAQYGALWGLPDSSAMGIGFTLPLSGQQGLEAVDGIIVAAWFAMGIPVGLWCLGGSVWAALVIVTTPVRHPTIEAITLGALGCGAFVQFPLASIASGELGFLFWVLAGLAASRIGATSELEVKVARLLHSSARVDRSRCHMDDINLEAATYPLVVRLDGTLLPSLRQEEAALAITYWLQQLWPRISSFWRPGARSPAEGPEPLDYDALPYNPIVLRFINQTRARGARVYLIGSSRPHLERVAASLKVFDGILVEGLDAPLQRRSRAFRRQAIRLRRQQCVRPSALVAGAARLQRTAGETLTRKLSATGISVAALGAPQNKLHTWLRAMRVHQYAKNALLFVPLLTAHQFTAPALLSETLAFVAFSMCASAVYIINDLIDLPADRQHPKKRNRPFAAGALPISAGLAAAPVLLLVAFTSQASCRYRSSEYWPAISRSRSPTR